jgi:type IV pilus assembly protein PilB
MAESETQILTALAQARITGELSPVFFSMLGIETCDLLKLTISPVLLQKIPESFARINKVIPIEETNSMLKVACPQPWDYSLRQQIAMLAGMQVQLLYSSIEDVAWMLDKHYQRSFQVKVLRQGSDGYVIKLVNDLFYEAIHYGASDIHIEPYARDVVVRFRQDGVLREVKKFQPQARIAPELLSRIKVMASLDIAEKRRPQDGRIHIDVGGRTVDVRISILPVQYGQKAVMRILDRTSVELDLLKLGLAGRNLTLLRKHANRPWGMVLITGPTGSGKTTTLYSIIKEIQSAKLNISTVEDPIEYKMDRINQTAVKHDIGLDFAAALRSLLRQDPDVIMVGEIRDKETADLAVRASLTGHLVFSTLHTNDAPTAVTRLADMGIEPFLVANSLSLVVAQRLVRKSCPHCLEQYQPAPEHLELAGEQYKNIIWKKGKGCFRCADTGFQGRIGLFEMMEMSEAMRDLAHHSLDTGKIRKLAQQEGMQTLRQDGWDKAKSGLTTIDEVLRETL